DRYAKASDRADVVILDLEDAVAPAARLALTRTPLDPNRTVVRINPATTADHAEDLRALRELTTRPSSWRRPRMPATSSRLPAGGSSRCVRPRAGCCGHLTSPRSRTPSRSCGGAEDLVAATGGSSSRNASGSYRDMARLARVQTLLAAATSGKRAIDSVYLDITDLAGLADEAADAVASGFAAKACIHPSQVGVVRAAYVPTPDSVARARR